MTAEIPIDFWHETTHQCHCVIFCHWLSHWLHDDDHSPCYNACAGRWSQTCPVRMDLQSPFWIPLEPMENDLRRPSCWFGVPNSRMMWLRWRWWQYVAVCGRALQLSKTQSFVTLSVSLTRCSALATTKCFTLECHVWNIQLCSLHALGMRFPGEVL